jgi:hypothetical protein
VNPPPNNGMHPTRDTLPLIFLKRLGRAGDAERYASSTYVNYASDVVLAL